MRRREAIRVFKEICQCMPDASVSSVSLSPNAVSKTDFELRLRMAIDKKSHDDMVALVSKHGLTLKESEGSMLICGSETKPNYIQVSA